jgi:hypothetical protein
MSAFLRPFRPASKQHDDIAAAPCEIDAPRAQMYTQFENAVAYRRNTTHQSLFQPF